ncbi:MAG: hypothetical protein EAY65_01580 [Alphaproteobacteria bacterium]|nr:MAG: hypothetical protein EAY65_01580 [Alphaproteobacteria bacterium]
MKRTNLIDAMLSDLVLRTEEINTVAKTVASASKCFTEDDNAETCIDLLTDVYWEILVDPTLCQFSLPHIALTCALLCEFDGSHYFKRLWAKRAKAHFNRVKSFNTHHMELLSSMLANN